MKFDLFMHARISAQTWAGTVKSGFITPLAVGFTKATGMVFVPSTSLTEDWEKSLRRPAGRRPPQELAVVGQVSESRRRDLLDDRK